MEEKTRILEKLNNDNTRPVLFNESFGGSESQLRLLLKYLPDENFKDINLILNNASFDLLEKDRINILWMQHFVNQEEAKNLGLKDYVDKVDFIVFNSNFIVSSAELANLVLKSSSNCCACFSPSANSLNFPLISAIIANNGPAPNQLRPKMKGKIFHQFVSQEPQGKSVHVVGKQYSHMVAHIAAKGRPFVDFHQREFLKR